MFCGVLKRNNNLNVFMQIKFTFVFLPEGNVFYYLSYKYSIFFPLGVSVLWHKCD